MPQQLFTWRRLARQPVVIAPTVGPPMFVPAVVAAASPEPIARHQKRRRERKVADVVGTIALEIDGVSVRIGRGADARTVAAVIRALRAGA